jgi:hypothetical protein
MMLTKLSLVLVIITVITSLSACSSPVITENTQISPPPSSITTPISGYKYFGGRAGDLSISFEYPDYWLSSTRQTYPHGEYLFLYIPSSDGVISTYIQIRRVDDIISPYFIETAIQQQLDLIKDRKDFKLLSNNNEIRMGNATGKEICFSYHDIWIGENPFDHFIYERLVFVSNDERAFWITLRVASASSLDESKNKYQKAQLGFEHLLSSFKFLN